MTRSYLRQPSPAAALVQLARLKAGLSQRELADRASVPATMISAYERDRRQPTLETLRKLLRAAGFELRMRLEPYDPHDEILDALDRTRTPEERDQRDRQVDAWRQAMGSEESWGADCPLSAPGAPTRVIRPTLRSTR